MSAEHKVVTTRLLRDYFRLAADNCAFKVPGRLTGTPGYFRFGADTVCYGHLADGPASPGADDRLYDALASIVFDGDHLCLPFVPEQVADNLRCERYLESVHKEASFYSQAVRKAYYLIRPLLGVGIRKHLQRGILRARLKSVFPSWPVDSTIDQLCRRLLALYLQAHPGMEIPFIWFWPFGCSACIMMTHDVETRDGLDFCDALMDLDDAYQIKSSFQLIPGARYKVSPLIRDTIHDRGFEINVHDWAHDGQLFSSKPSFGRRIAQINNVAQQWDVKGFRSGALYRNQGWLAQLTTAYDMSVPAVAHMEPQAGGCCTVTPYFLGDLLEIPVTTIQDYALFHILGDYSTDLWRSQLETIVGVNGVASFIAHPDYLREKRAYNIYRELLGHLRKVAASQNAWIAQPHEVNTWWRQRHQLTILTTPDGVRVQGEGADRAIIAYARWDGQQLRYRLDVPQHGITANAQQEVGTW